MLLLGLFFPLIQKHLILDVADDHESKCTHMPIPRTSCHLPRKKKRLTAHFPTTSSQPCDQILRLATSEIDPGKTAVALRSGAQIIQNKKATQAKPIPRLGRGITAKRPKPIVKSHANACYRGSHGKWRSDEENCRASFGPLWLENERDPLSTRRREKGATLNEGQYDPQHLIVRCQVTGRIIRCCIMSPTSAECSCYYDLT